MIQQWLMGKNDGIIITMAYPETIVMVADEWYSPFLKYLGVGKKNYVKAGHAALVLIHKEKGDLEYHDFGRYITNEPNGRVRGKKYDRELDFPLKAIIENDAVSNIDEILLFLASNPNLTHGDGKLVASVCNEIDYDLAKSHVQKLQRKGAIRYAAFIKDASNCARFVTTTLIAGVVNLKVKKKLIKSQWFTPSTVGNVVLASSNGKVFEVLPGKVSDFTSSISKENRNYFLDRLPKHKADFSGTLEPKHVEGVDENAQWLSGIAAGAWFELTNHKLLAVNEIRMRRISPYGNIDIDAVFESKNGFTLEKEFNVIHNSNCFYCTVRQEGKVHCLEYKRDF